MAQQKLEQVAALFDMKPSEYAKAVLYRDIGVFNEPLDQRRRTWRQKQREEAEEQEDPENWPDEETVQGEEEDPAHGRFSTAET